MKWVVELSINRAIAGNYTETLTFDNESELKEELRAFAAMQNDDETFCKNGDVIVTRSIRWIEGEPVEF